MISSRSINRLLLTLLKSLEVDLELYILLESGVDVLWRELGQSLLKKVYLEFQREVFLLCDVDQLGSVSEMTQSSKSITFSCSLSVRFCLVVDLRSSLVLVVPSVFVEPAKALPGLRSGADLTGGFALRVERDDLERRGVGASEESARELCPRKSTLASVEPSSML